MADAPERLWLWPAEPEDGVDKCVSFPDQPYPSGSTEYIRADVARSDAELALADALSRAGATAYRICAETRHVTLGRQTETAILALAPAEALAEERRLREERDRFEAALGRACLVGGTTYLVERAESAEAERDAALARVEKLRHQVTEASDPDFIWGALDNVHDMDVTLDDYAAAVSRAIRAALDEDARNG